MERKFREAVSAVSREVLSAFGDRRDGRAGWRRCKRAGVREAGERDLMGADEGSAQFVSNHCVHLGASRSTVWDQIRCVERFPEWWPWLGSFDGTELVPGAVWRCTVNPPLPYRLRFSITLDEVEAPFLATATLAGDIIGSARLELHERGAGCTAALSSTLLPRQGLLRIFAQLAPSIVRFGHDWVLETGARQFERALSLQVGEEPPA